MPTVQQILLFIQAQMGWYTLAVPLAALLGKRAWDSEGARRLSAIEREREGLSKDVAALQLQRFDQLKALVEECRERVDDAYRVINELERVIAELERENARRGRRIGLLEHAILSSGLQLPPEEA